MKKTLFLIVLLIGIMPAAAADRVIDYVDPYAIALGVQPKEGQVVRLDAMVVLQKVKDGYILCVNPNLVQTMEMVQARAWLKTKSKYDQSTDLTGKLTKMIGVYKYTGLDGFKHTVYAFEEIKEEETQ